jgi:hypothetical protein
MKRMVKILFRAIISLILIYLAIFAFLALKGKAIVEQKLKSWTQKNVTIGYLGIIPPLNLQLNNLDIPSVVKMDSLYISPSLLGLLSGNIVFNEIKLIRPMFTYERSPQEQLSDTESAKSKALISEESAKGTQQLRLIFKRLTIKDGKVNFIDRTVSEQGIKIAIESIFFNLKNLYMLPRSVITNFDLKAKIPWPQGGEVGKIEAQGWLNLFKKDIQAKLKITDIDGIYLFPYYSNWVDLEKARIEKAKLNFSSDIRGADNDITAQCHLELTDIVRRSRAPEETETKAAKITDAVLDIFRALNQGKIVLDFNIKTKMDTPAFGFGDIKSAFEDKLTQGKKSNIFDPQYVLAIPAKLLEGLVKGATDVSKAVVDGTFAVGDEIKKRAEEAFKKEKEGEIK